MKIYVNDAYLPYLEASTRTQIFFGGSSSGKSFFLAQRAVMDVLRFGRNYLILRNVARTVRNSVYNEICKAIYAMGMERFFSINKSDMTITCKSNRRQMIFAGLDNVEKLKSTTPANGVLTDIWIEEATESSYESYKQLTKRLRGKTDVSKRITLSFNPIAKTHWIYKEFFNRWEEDKSCYHDAGLSVLKTTYLDNHFLMPDDIAGLEDESDPYFYDVYTLGNWGVLGNLIFRNWEKRDLSALKGKLREDRVYWGCDFGFSNDPTAAIQMYYDRDKNTLYILDEIYERGLFMDQLADMLRKKSNRAYIACDCAEPRSIEDLRRHGVNALPCRKGPDSLRYGIAWIQQQKVVIDINCQNTINEFQLYHWREDKNGNAIKQPIDKFNHAIDAIRYGTEDLQIDNFISAGRRI